MRKEKDSCTVARDMQQNCRGHCFSDTKTRPRKGGPQTVHRNSLCFIVAPHSTPPRLPSHTKLETHAGKDNLIRQACNRGIENSFVSHFGSGVARISVEARTVSGRSYF